MLGLDKMSREKKIYRHGQPLLGAGFLLLFSSTPVLANPTGGTVTQGSATFSSSGSTFNINQTSANAFINWNSFNIGAGETVNFNQPGASSVTFNQINDINPSQILGNLNANGYVVLENANGFYIGGQAVLNAHGLVMTTATSPAMNLSDGGPWSFDAPPPTAKIQNYGQINITGGGTAYLIAADIVNGGTITAPNGHIGLYDGETVLVSMSPNGEGLSAQVTLPQGSVDNEGNLTADGGSVVAQAQFVNQNGIIQANTAENVNGTIELLGSSSVALGANSVISAQGSAQGVSSGGTVTIKAGDTFSDQPGSTINVAGGAQGGNGGQVEISAPQMGTINSVINGQAQDGFIGGTLTIDPADIWLDSANTAPSGYTFVNIDSFSGMSQINLQADDDIVLNTIWSLAAQTVPATLSLTAGNDITLNNSSGISAGVNWTVNLTAGSGLNLGVSSLISADNLNLAFPSISSADGNVNFQALDNIEVSSLLTLPDFGSAATFSLTAGNNITVDDGSGISAGQNWTINLNAGTGFVPTTGQPTPASGNDGIYLDGAAYVEAQNGDINLRAANEVQVGWAGAANPPGQVNTGQGSINTFNGGNISVTTQYGDVNTGSNPNGFQYSSTAPYESPAPGLGGISTAAGGNVTIAAGGDVISYLPSSSTTATEEEEDGGTGAFGSQPGNVTITAGGSVYGNYVVANGVGTVTAGHDVGAAAGDPFALSLISGGWNVNANGTIYLQEVRNPSGIFNSRHFFDYSPQAYVDLTANEVYLTGQNLPRPDGAVPVLYPPILGITAGAGGVTLENNVTLFPSPYQNLDITTTGGGDLSSTGGSSTPYELLMSDSARTRWSGSGNFGNSDHGTLANEPMDTDPVIINISGNMEDLDLITTKATEITVGGDMINCGFSGQNLKASDITSINVGGVIYNTSAYAFVTLPQAIPAIPIEDLLLGMSSSWDDIFTLAVNPAAIASLTVPAGTTQQQLASYALTQAGLFNVLLNQNNQLSGSNPGFVYNPATGQLGFAGNMSQAVMTELAQPITILQLVNGVPATYTGANGQTYFKTTTISWANASAVQTLYAASQYDSSPTLAQLGYRIGGPGQFDVTADAIALGNSYGILSCGVEDPQGGFGRYANLASITPEGATLNVTVTGPSQLTYPQSYLTLLAGQGLPPLPDNPVIPSLDMLTSTIASLNGGDVNVLDTGGSMDLGSQELFSQTQQVGFGVFTTDGGDVNVTALGDVDIDGSRIATYDGGNVFVESETGNVNVGSGGDALNGVYVAYLTAAGKAASYAENTYGSGIQALTLVPPQHGESFPPNAATVPGNITVITPQGSIVATTAGIIQEALNGSFAPGPTITLTAGTFPSGNSPGYVGNIDLGNSGVIGGTVNLSANGNITGQIISRQNSTVNAAQSFSGTLLAGGSADVTGGGTISGTIVGVGGVNVSGAGGVTASLLGQNVSVNGGSSQDTLGSSAGATSATQSAAQSASSQSQQQVAADTSQGDDKKKKNTQIRKIGRVTVILASAK